MMPPFPRHWNDALKRPTARVGLSRGTNRRIAGFTLVEIAACLVIVGLLTGVAALSLRGAQRNLDLDSWVEQMTVLDQSTRQRAQSQGVAWRLVFDLNESTVWSETSAKLAQEQNGNPLWMPRGWRIRDVRVHRNTRSPDLSRSEQEVLGFAMSGVSRSYAVELENENDARFWLLIAGGSGQWMTMNHEDQVQDIFAALRAAGDDSG